MKTIKSTSVKIASCAILFISCSNGEMESKQTSYADAKYTSKEYINSEAPVQEMEDKSKQHITTDNLLNKDPRMDLKIIKNASSQFLVANVDSASEVAIKLAQTYYGYVSNMSLDQNSYRKNNAITLSIPSKHFETYMKSINKLALFVDYNNITTKDVTSEYVDLNNRVRVKEEVKKRYEDILRSKAKTVNDVLNAERQIQTIQEEIEVAKGRIKYINAKTSYSTIDLKLYEKIDYQEKPNTYNKSFWSKSKKALSTGWEIILNFILMILYIWPILLIIILTIIIIKRVLRQK